MNNIEKAINYFYKRMELGNMESDYQQEVFKIAAQALEKQIILQRRIDGQKTYNRYEMLARHELIEILEECLLEEENERN